MNSSKQKASSFSSYQKFVIAVLAFLQFTVILDFMIMSPLGATMMPALNMTTAQFGLAVSVYAFSAGIAGLLAAGFADKFDRKKLLLFFYCGFVLGTLFCGLANTFHFLLFARLVTGLFGGVVGSIVFAITTDLFEFQLRGRVMGFIQTAFAASQILGIPIGLYISNLWGWHASFLMIVGVSVIVGCAIFKFLKPINEHLKIHSDKSAFGHLQKTISNRRYLQAFATTALLSIGGFMLMPFGSAFTVNNLGIHIEKLPLIYLVTGICAIFMGPIIGRASDKFGKYKTFVFGTTVSVIMVVIYTNLGETPIEIVMLVNALMFVGIFSRMIPSQALMSAIPSADSRGSFMSISSSLQQISGGFASVVAGLIVVQGIDGKLQHFDTIGYVMVGTALITVFLMYFIHKAVPETKN
ncbi:MAG: MFS transporter [Bdellovibrio sp.]|nr:MFS transporter [Bdellovibrio sp.]